jgi:hypothetical protein
LRSRLPHTAAAKRKRPYERQSHTTFQHKRNATGLQHVYLRNKIYNRWRTVVNRSESQTTANKEPRKL